MTRFMILLLNLFVLVSFASPRLLLRPWMIRPRPVRSALSPADPAVSVFDFYKPILDLNDPSVQENAKFAVSEYSKQVNSTYSLVSVVTARYKTLTSGMIYRFYVKATNGVVSGNYTAFVYDKPSTNTKKLLGFIKFSPIKTFLPNRVESLAPTSPGVGTYKDITDLNSPLVQDIAKFAVTEYSKRQNSTYRIVKLKSKRIIGQGQSKSRPSPHTDQAHTLVSAHSC